jgi:OOP family OmpA-OmpF porin
MQRLMGDKFTIGGEVAGAAGPVGRHLSAQTDITLRAEILTWSRSRGLFGGLSLDGATLRPDANENNKLYGREVSQRDILQGRVRGNRETREFDALLARISPAPVNATENREPRPAAPLNGPGGRLTLGEKQVHFATGSAEIRNADRALADLAQEMKDHPDWKIRVEGHTDNTGSRAINSKLSQERAEAVMNWLADHGVDRSRMTARGYGDARPVGDNSTEEGRGQNRRVEIVRTDRERPTGE